MDESQTTDAARFERLIQHDESPRSGRETFGAAIALLALVVGVPALLLVAAGPPPVPTSVPGAKDFAQQLSIEDLVSALIAIVWLVWLFFCGCVVLEVIAARRGGLAAPIPLGGPLQRLARVLVGALLLAGIVAGPAQAASAASVSEAPSSAPTTSAGLLQVSLDAEVQALDDLVEDRAAAAAEEQAAHPMYTVKAPQGGYHDNLWDIADQHLGDGRRYHEIYELNKDVVQADGRKVELARLIQPGWELALPDDAVGVERIATPAPASAVSAPDTGPDTGPVDAAVDTQEQSSLTEGVGDWVGGSGLLAASVLGAVLLQRRRRLGRAPDEDARSIEADLRVAATVERSAWLDVALRRLTLQCRHGGTVPPSAYAVLLSDDAVELLLSPGAPEGVEGWTVHDEGRRWRCERGDDLAAPSDVPAYPALVSIGVDDQDRDVLLDLESAGGVISIGGDVAVAEQIACSIAVQAATAPWADTVAVTASDLPEAIADIGTDRLRMVDDLGAQLDDIERHVRALPDDVLHGRVSRRSPVPSRLVVSGRAPSVDVADRLGLLAGGGSRALSVVVVGEHAAARWRLRVDERGHLEVPQLRLSAVANRLGPAQAEAVAELFAACHEPERIDTDRFTLPVSTRAGDDAAWATARHRIGVIGRVEVLGGDDAAVTRIDQSTEILTFVALHPEGVHPTVLSAAIWPRGVTADVLDAAIDRARSWLGPDVDGTHLLRSDADGRLLLAESVVCDWHVVMSLLQASRRATSLGAETDLLRRALVLVRGEPFERVPRGRYAWVAREDLPRLIALAVVDAAERLVQILGGDPGGAAHAAETGLLVAPGHQRLWRALLRIRSASEGVAGVHRTLEQMGAALDGTAPDGRVLDAETEALIDELLPADQQETPA